jgi:hypothetical protein
MSQTDGSGAGALISNLGLLTHAKGFSFWLYRADEPLETLRTSGFFDPAAGMVRPGDLVVLSGADGTAIVHMVEVENGIDGEGHLATQRLAL